MPAPPYARWFEVGWAASGKVSPHHLACLLQGHPHVRPRVLSLLFRTPYRLRQSVLGWPPRTAWHWRDLLDALGRDDRHLLRVLDLVLVVGFVLVVILAFYLFATG